MSPYALPNSLSSFPNVCLVNCAAAGRMPAAVVPQGSDQGFCNKLIKQHKGHRRFDEIKTKPTWFVIKHFAGPVSYCSDGFLDKNKDQLSNDLIECMGSSTNGFIVDLFKQDVKYSEVLNKDFEAAGPTKKKKKYTVSSEFKDQLSSLMDIVDLTDPHFVRCIKPNPQNEADKYDRKAVTEQLRYGGVLQVVQVSRAGYPVRINHQECWDDFKIVASPQIIAGLKHVDDTKVRAQKLLEHLTTELHVPKPLHGLPWAVGKTLVFFKLPAFERIKFARLELMVKSATQIQSAWRRHVQMHKYKAICLFTRHLQAILRRFPAKGDFGIREFKRVRYATRIQSCWKRLMAKSQKAQEQASSLRKRNEELEAIQLQLQSEKKSLLGRVKELEEAVEKMKSQMDEVKVQAQEAAKLSADSKIIVETESLKKLEQSLQDKETEMAQVKEDLTSAKTASVKQQELRLMSQSRYQQLLKNSAMQSVSGLPGAAPKAASKQRSTGQRNVFIQFAGASGTGKTSLLEALIAEHDPQQLPKFNEQKSNFMAHHQIQVGEKLVKVLDCSGNARAAHLVKERFGRSTWVFIVYDLSKKESFDTALALTQEVHEAGARPLLFGNKCHGGIANGDGIARRYNVERGAQIKAESELMKVVDVAAAKDAAVRAEGEPNSGSAFESSNLMDAVKFAINSEEREERKRNTKETPREKASSISMAIDSVKSWFGGDRSKSAGILRPSLKGTKNMKQARKDPDPSMDLRPVQELQDSESAVTCICFGQERQHKAYVLLATASKDGTVVVYRCYRTEMEIAMLSDQDFGRNDDFSNPPADNSNIAVHSRLVGHSRAITSIFFNLLEDQLVTTSIDKSVRFWSIESGEMLKVFTDSSPVPVATFLPFNPQVFVAANSNAVLRLVNVQNGLVLQKLKVETEVRALKFDDTGLFLLAGTKSGSIHALEATDSNTLKFKFKVNLARGGVTCITFVPAANQQPACLLVNTSDCSASIIDCTYDQGALTNLTVRHRVRVAHELLPLKNCYSPSGQGYLISGSENKEVHIYSLGKGANYKMQYLKHHQVPVVAVAVNLQDTLLASADSLGRIVLWRRLDFSHIPDGA
ncbi:unnamed protein product [Effrenium voratum]|nr:unnamed protein product [Effrenium voratum]